MARKPDTGTSRRSTRQGTATRTERPKPRATRAAAKPATVRKTPVRKTSTRSPRPNPVRDAAAVEQVNRRYYDAFQTLDIQQVSRFWWHDDSAGCVHPGWDLRHGWPAVRASYEEIFASTGLLRFSLGEVRVRVKGEVAWVSCIENLVTEDVERDSATYLGAVLATNVFERRGDEWRLIHHHASPFAGEDMNVVEGPIH